MTDAPQDLRLFSEAHLLAQLPGAPRQNGYFTVEFYADERGRPSRKPTGRVEVFYLYPSGGTLRDKDFNLLWYDSAFDTYRGFQPPAPKS
jgi:hypothetical protein